MADIIITKRDGTKELLDLNKFHKVVSWACDKLKGVSASEVELKSHIQFFDQMKSSDVQETLIKAAADLITEECPNYQYVAGRLINYQLRKEVYGQYDPIPLFKHVENVVEKGFYEPALLEWYTAEDYEKLDKNIDHTRDDILTYAAMEQFRGKYLVKNRTTNEIFETPQIAYMLISMTLFKDETVDRLDRVIDFYNSLSLFDISLPTPIMSGVRTSVRQFSSCVLVETDDTLDSINATSSAIVKYVSKKAGIGIGAGNIRALGSSINGGYATHTGVIPFFKLFQSAVKSCSQGGVRGGAATLYYPCWHLEVEDILVLKNNKGTEDNRIRHLDYGVQFNKLMYERLIKNENITLFSPSDVPGLYEAFYSDQEKFEELYTKAERSYKTRKKSIKAIDLFSAFMTERKDTGRIYLMNVDHANDHGSFIPELAPIRQSNLCCEIDLPTKPLSNINDDQGEISLCTLAAINWGNIKSPEDFKKPCEMAVRALDALLTYQEYPVKAAEVGTMNRRPLGIGIINFAYWMAKNNMNYTNPNLDMIDEYAEAWSYYLIEASIQLAREKEHCLLNDQTKYSQGIFPKDTYKKDVDELVDRKPTMNWNKLRTDVKIYGIRNSTLMALMPSETSSQISNATNGIEPPRAFVSVKQSKDGILKQVVPKYRKFKNKYELLWDQKSPEGYIKIVSVLQKWIDQGISVNTSYNPQFFDEEKIPMSVMLKHIIMFYKYGGKQLYYFNTFDGATDEIEAPQHHIEDFDLPEINTEEDCEACVL